MSHQPTLRQLRYLCAIGEHLHFGKAAQACHVSQSTLSTALQELESNLGVSLVERTHKSIIITRIGEEIIARGERILSDVEDLMAAADASRTPFSGEMRIGVIPTIAPYVLPDLLGELRDRYPDFKLFIREDLSEHLTRALETGELDLLLLALPYRAERVETEHLFYDEFLLACDPSHPLTERPSICTQDLAGSELLLLEDGHCLRDHALEACRLSLKDVSVPYHATSLNTIVQMVASRIGITLIPKMAVDKQILSGTNICVRRLNDTNVHRSIGLMWRHKSPRASEFRLFGDMVRKLNEPDAAGPASEQEGDLIRSGSGHPAAV